jgi:integrase
MNVRVIPHKRDKSKWAVDYRCPVTKKRKYESFETKKEATDRKKELEGDEAKGTYRPMHRRTWAEFIAEYRAKILDHQKPETRDAYDEGIRHFERLCFPTEMRLITTKAIDGFSAARRKDTTGKHNPKPVSLNTVNKALRHIRTVLLYAHRWGYLPIVPQIEMLKTPDPEPRAISRDQFDKIIEVAQNLDERFAASEARRRVPKRQNLTRGPAHNPPSSDWWVAYLSVGYLAGLRWNEILSLRWADLRFTAKPEIRIWNQKAGRHDHVPMVGILFDRLKAWMSRCPNVADDGLVFPHACHYRTIQTTWERLQEWAKITEPYRFHDLRVSFCTNLVAAGTEAPTLMKLARHRSIATTMKYYRGRTDDADRRAMERMEAAFSIVEKQ